MDAFPHESLRRWTGEECRRLVESGSVERPEWIELVDGLLWAKHRTTPAHRSAQRRTASCLGEAFGEDCLVLSGVALFLSDSMSPSLTSSLCHMASAKPLRRRR